MTLAFALLALAVASPPPPPSSSPAAAADRTGAAKPHIFLVLADDLGHGNVGWARKHYNCSTDEVQTPRLDALVEEGVELSRFYAYHMCSPTRSALQTGRHPMHVNMVNANPTIYNATESTGTGAGIPRNMTGVATKLRSVGYQAHMVGKWDAGMATPTHTPQGRGYQSSLGYFHHGNEYWSFGTGDGFCPEGVDLWDTDHPAHAMAPTSHSIDRNNLTAYEEFLFLRRMLAVLDDYTPDPAAPLFLFYAAHLVHDPLQVPQPYLDRMSKAGGGPIDNATANDNTRLTYHAMAYYLDEQVGKVVDVLKSNGMWANTLMLFISDNGGPIYGGGNNYPLRGGKYSEFEGGVRVAAFASGGVIPAAARGSRATGLAAIADVYVTLCAIAGVDASDTEGDAAGLPKVDGVDLRPMLYGTGISPRIEVPLEPLEFKDLEALDEHARSAGLGGAGAGAGAPPAFDVHVGSACGSGVAKTSRIGFFGDKTLKDCEAACAALPACQMFSHRDDSSASKAHFCALYNASSWPQKVETPPKFDCGCRGTCPAKPGPGPSPPGPPSPNHKMCNKLQGWDYLDANLTVTDNVLLNDCCGVCNTTKGCAVSVWTAAGKGGHPNGTCATKVSRSQPVYSGGGTAAFLPGDVPVPPPVITEQAGLVVGDMKLIVGVSVNMAVFTGPRFPNASTPWTNNNSIKVPSFGCSAPYKTGCLFNVTADPTEHHDLWQEQPQQMARMLERLKEISRSRFDPNRGPGDQRACAQMKKNADSQGRGYFGPWLP